MIVAGLPMLPAELALEPPPLLPGSGQACDVSAGWMAQAAGDVPGEWLAALQAALARAAGARTEPLPGEEARERPASRRLRLLGAEEEPEAPKATEAGESAATRLAPAVWDGFEARLDPVAQAPESGRAEEPATTAPRPSAPESLPASVGPPLPSAQRAENGSARPGSGSEPALRTVPGAPVGRVPALEPARAPAVGAASDPVQATPMEVRKTESRSPSAEATPFRPAREPELAFRAKITQRPISPDPTAAAPATARPGPIAAEAAPTLEPPRAARLAAGLRQPEIGGGHPEAVARAAPPAPPEHARSAEPGQAAPPTDRPGRDARQPHREGQAPAGVAAPEARPAAPGGEAAASGAGEPVRATRAARARTPVAVAAELAPQPAAPSGAATETVKRSASASSVPPEVPAPSAPVGEPVRRVELRVGAMADANVSLQVIDRGGRLEVAVRTPDHDLAGTLRQALPDLVRRMEQVGLRAETWAPDGAPVRTAEPAEPARTAADLADRREGGQHAGGGEPGGERDEARDRRAQLEPGEGAAEDGKETQQWAAWLWR